MTFRSNVHKLYREMRINQMVTWPCSVSVIITLDGPLFLLYMSVLSPKFCRSVGLSFTLSGNDIIGCEDGVY